MYKILLLGDYISQIHEIPISDALSKKGHLVRHFKISDYRYSIYFNKLYNLQIKLGFGPLVYKINKQLLREIENNNYHVLFLYRPLLIYPKTLKKIKKTCLVFCYNNDDPFSKKYSKWMWKNYINGLKFCDHIFYYREKNENDYVKRGFTNISLLRSYYIKTLNYKIENISDNNFKADVCFIGHYENDGRDLLLKKIIDTGIDIKIFGPNWEKSSYYNYFCNYLGYKIVALDSESYNLALNSVKIALVFLSTLNNDTYTRRCFEIPAAGPLMISQYSDDLNNLFTDGVEAVYFKTSDELMIKIQYFLENESERLQIAMNGRKRLIYDSHEVSNRVDYIINKINFYINRNN